MYDKLAVSAALLTVGASAHAHIGAHSGGILHTLVHLGSNPDHWLYAAAILTPPVLAVTRIRWRRVRPRLRRQSWE